MSDDAPVGLGILGGACACVVGVVVVVFMFCMAVVDPTEYGVVLNRFNKQIDFTTVWRGGRHFILPVSEIVAFPATVQTLEFSNRNTRDAPPLKSRTSEGFDLYLHVVLQYRLIQDGVPYIYKTFQLRYASVLLKQANAVILEVASDYSAYDYWEMRKAIAEDMMQKVDIRLKTSNATCTGLQLMIIDLPDSFENKIVTTQVEKQKEKTREKEQEASLIRAGTEVTIAEYQKNITVTINQATATANLMVREADARATRSKINIETDAFTTVAEVLKFSPRSMVRYQKGLTYQGLTSANFLFGVESAVAVTGGAR